MSKFRLLFMISFLLVLGCQSAVFGQQSEDNLMAKVITIKMEKQHLAKVFRYLRVNYGILIGFEQSSLDSDHGDYDFETNLPSVGLQRYKSDDSRSSIEMEAETVFNPKKHWISINVQNEKLEKVLDIIVEQMKNYKWDINEGIVNIFPYQGRDLRFERLLETKINNFTFVKGSSINDITTNLKALPELQRFLIENKLNFTGVRSGMDIILNAQYGRRLDIEMNFSNLTFRELFNKIAKAKDGSWIIKKKRMLKTTREEHIDIDI